MTRRILTALVAALALVLCAVGVVHASTPPPNPPLPTPPGGFFGGIPSELLHPGGSLPGTNDFSCEPNAAHPNPVILVPGTAGGQQTNWGEYAPTLANAGYCVYALTYGAIPGAPWPISALGGFGPIETSAQQLSVFVDRVLASTGARAVDIVGHSQGTLMPNYYVKFLGGASKVDKYISLAPLWNGTNTAGAADILRAASRAGLGGRENQTIGRLCAACLEMATGSPFLAKIQAGGVYAPPVHYTNIMTRYDEAVVPYTSGYVRAANATNIVVQDQCGQDYSDHAAIAADPIAATDVLNALDPAHPRPIVCRFVPPFTG